jgi:protein-serine/threonine kinase
MEYCSSVLFFSSVCARAHFDFVLFLGAFTLACSGLGDYSGGDLYTVIKKGKRSTKENNSYFKQTIHGIAYLHSMGVAHRDIKPENLLLDARGHVKITDFGVSDVFRMGWEKTIHLSKGLCGSEPYIAPEQFEGGGES